MRSTHTTSDYEIVIIFIVDPLNNFTKTFFYFWDDRFRVGQNLEIREKNIFIFYAPKTTWFDSYFQMYLWSR